MKEDGRNKFWLMADVVSALIGPDRAGGETTDSEARKMAAEADIAEMKAGAMRADLVSAEAAGVEIDRAVAAVRAKLLTVPRQAGLHCIVRPDDAPLARRVLHTAMLEVLDELREL